MVMDILLLMLKPFGLCGFAAEDLLFMLKPFGLKMEHDP
jgi:hypothetical protein